MVRRPGPVVLEEEILEEGGAGAENDGVRWELDGRERSRRRDGMFRHYYYYYFEKKKNFGEVFFFPTHPKPPLEIKSAKPFDRLFTHQVILLVFFYFKMKIGMEKSRNSR